MPYRASHLITRARRRARSAVLASVVLGSLVACREAALSFGPTAQVARTRADQLFGALASRFNRVEHDARYDSARVLIAQSALAPSRLYDDSATWSASAAASRSLWASGTSSGGRYRLTSASSPPPRPANPGDIRQRVTLTRVGHETYAWDTGVDFAIGSVTAGGVDALVTALLGSTERYRGRDIHADVAAAFPRTAAVLGRVLTIETLQATPSADGTTTTEAVLRLHPRGLERLYPEYAAYLQRYAEPTDAHVVLGNDAAQWLDARLADGVARIRYRTQRGHLVTLTGAPTPLPDTTHLTVDWTMRMKMVRLGFRRLDLDLVRGASVHERSWTVVARREPDWVLPLAAERLVRSPLARPFAGSGSYVRLSVRDSSGAQTLVSRRTHLVVQESAITRLIASIGSGAVDDFEGGALQGQERFAREVFSALQADMRSLVP